MGICCECVNIFIEFAIIHHSAYLSFTVLYKVYQRDHVLVWSQFPFNIWYEPAIVNTSLELLHVDVFNMIGYGLFRNSVSQLSRHHTFLPFSLCSLYTLYGEIRLFDSERSAQGRFSVGEIHCFGWHDNDAAQCLYRSYPNGILCMTRTLTLTESPSSVRIPTVQIPQNTRDLPSIVSMFTSFFHFRHHYAFTFG